MVEQLNQGKKEKIKSKIAKFIHDNFLFGSTSSELGDDDSFLEQGIIDSTGVLELVNFIQKTFDIFVEDDELIPDNLDSLNKITVFINSKQQG